MSSSIYKVAAPEPYRNRCPSLLTCRLVLIGLADKKNLSEILDYNPLDRPSARSKSN
jgi:hypothetical protein